MYTTYASFGKQMRFQSMMNLPNILRGKIYKLKMILGYFSIHSAVRDKCNVCDDFLQYHILFMDFHILGQLGYYQYNVK